MQCITQHPALQNLRRWILTTRDAHGLYSQVGFIPVKAPERYMELHRPDVYETTSRNSEQIPQARSEKRWTVVEIPRGANGCTGGQGSFASLRMKGIESSGFDGDSLGKRHEEFRR